MLSVVEFNRVERAEERRGADCELKKSSEIHTAKCAVYCVDRINPNHIEMGIINYPSELIN